MLCRALNAFYKAEETLGFSSYKNVVAWVANLEARPAVAKGLMINSSRGDGEFKEYHSP